MTSLPKKQTGLFYIVNVLRTAVIAGQSVQKSVGLFVQAVLYPGGKQNAGFRAVSRQIVNNLFPPDGQFTTMTSDL